MAVRQKASELRNARQPACRPARKPEACSPAAGSVVRVTVTVDMATFFCSVAKVA